MKQLIRKDIISLNNIQENMFHREIFSGFEDIPNCPRQQNNPVTRLTYEENSI